MSWVRAGSASRGMTGASNYPISLPRGAKKGNKGERLGKEVGKET